MRSTVEVAVEKVHAHDDVKGYKEARQRITAAIDRAILTARIEEHEMTCEGAPSVCEREIRLRRELEALK